MSQENREPQGQAPAPFTGKLTKTQAGILRTLWDLENRQACQSSLRNGLHSSAAKLVERGLIWKQDRWPARPLYDITPTGIPAALEAWKEVYPQLAQQESEAWRQQAAKERSTQEVQPPADPEQREQQQQEPKPPAQLPPTVEPRPSRPAAGQAYGVPMSMSDGMTLTAEQRAMLGRLIDAFEMESICGVDFAAPFDERLKLIDDCRDLLGVHRGWSVPGETN